MAWQERGENSFYTSFSRVQNTVTDNKHIFKIQAHVPFDPAILILKMFSMDIRTVFRGIKQVYSCTSLLVDDYKTKVENIAKSHLVHDLKECILW